MPKPPLHVVYPEDPFPISPAVRAQLRDVFSPPDLTRLCEWLRSLAAWGEEQRLQAQRYLARLLVVTETLDGRRAFYTPITTTTRGRYS